MALDLNLKEAELHNLTEQLVESYSHCGKLHHLGLEPLPSREVVTEVTMLLQELLFPGFGLRQNLHQGNISRHVANLIDTLHDLLSVQIARALKHENCGDCPEGDFESEGQTKAVELLRSLPDIRRTLEDDVDAAYRGDPAAKSHLEIVFCYPGFEAIAIYRLAHVLYRLRVPFIPRMMTELAHSRTGIDIHPGATIGPGFFIDHGTGVVIGETCVIGREVRLYQGVTLGSLSFDRDESGELVHGSYKRHPTLKDRVVVYANATILGGKTEIGEGAVIGSNVWITKSIEPYAVVVLENPQHKIKPRPPAGRDATDNLMYFI